MFSHVSQTTVDKLHLFLAMNYSMNAIMSRKSCQVRAAAHEGRTAKTTTVGAADIVDSMSCTKIEDSVESTQQQWNIGLLDDFVVHEARLDEELWVRCL